MVKSFARRVALVAAVILTPWTLSAGPPVPTITVSPSSYSLRVNPVAAVTKTFSASVSNLTNKTVTWSVNGVSGGNSTVGTITAAGLYTAPLAVPANTVIKVRATSVAQTTLFAESTVTLQNPTPVISSLTPTAANIGTFAVKIAGTGFLPTSKVQLGGANIAATYASSTELRFTTTDATARTTDVAVVNPDPGTATSNHKSFTIMPPVSLSVTPETATVRIGATRQFNGSVSNSVDRTVTWYVNNVKNGNTTFGGITDSGLYTPPVTLPADAAGVPLPAPVTVTIKGISNVNNTVVDTSVVTLQNAIPVITTVTPGSAQVGTNTTFTIDGNGFAAGLTVKLGSASLTVTSLTPWRVTAATLVKANIGGLAALSLNNPNPGAANSNGVIVTLNPGPTVMTSQAAAKFLQRASWGPSPDSVVHLQQVGIPRWFDEQFAAPISDLPEPIAESTSISPAQRTFYMNGVHGADQLRQRMGFALSQILVVSGVKIPQAQQLVPYMRLLNRGAFGNYFQLLRDVTVSPAMGRFLDMVNNQKQNSARGIEPNENYARELLQLFTVGLVQLGMEGTPTAIPTFSEDTVKQFARVFTGWTFATRPGETPRFPNPSYYAQPMIPFEQYHDTTPKTLLNGATVPGGLTASLDLDAAISNIRVHPNVPPFIALRLIQRFVMGNPSAGYIQRVATVFQSTGGELFPTLKAILTDPEADAPVANQGKLREPVLYILSLMRGLNATVTLDNNLSSYDQDMGQDLWFAGSVFNYFSPFFRKNGIVSPEFQVSTPSVAMNRVNFAYRATRNSISSNVLIDSTALEALASDPNALVEALNQALLCGNMSLEMRNGILKAISTTTDVRVRARNAAYLVAGSSQFQVEP